MNADGSGTWTRIDHRAFRFASLYEAGPRLHEVTSRTTYDLKSGDVIEAPMLDFATAKFRNLELPAPVPRAIRSVFAFDRTEKEVLPERCSKPLADGVVDAA